MTFAQIKKMTYPKTPIGWFVVTAEFYGGTLLEAPPVDTTSIPAGTVIPLTQLIQLLKLPGTIPAHRVKENVFKVGDTEVLFIPDPEFGKVLDAYEEGFEGIQVLIRVVVKCDFLFEEKRVVDGNHLCGVLPSGNGIAGDDFESWFVLDLRKNA